jgi:hypothetical protein
MRSQLWFSCLEMRRLRLVFGTRQREAGESPVPGLSSELRFRIIERTLGIKPYLLRYSGCPRARRLGVGYGSQAWP